MARDNKLEIETRLGKRVVRTDRIVRFPRGIAGFESERAFVLLQVRPEAPLLVLQSVSTPQVGLLVTDPYSFLESYPVTIGDAEQNLLQLENEEEAAILVTVTIPESGPKDAVLNLTGPIVINHRSRVGLQVPQTGDGPSQARMGDLAARPKPEASGDDGKTGEPRAQLRFRGRGGARVGQGDAAGK